MLEAGGRVVGQLSSWSFAGREHFDREDRWVIEEQIIASKGFPLDHDDIGDSHRSTRCQEPAEGLEGDPFAWACGVENVTQSRGGVLVSEGCGRIHDEGTIHVLGSVGFRPGQVLPQRHRYDVDGRHKSQGIDAL